MAYLEKRYDGNFTLISSDRVARSQRNYLDERMEPLENTQQLKWHLIRFRMMQQSYRTKGPVLLSRRQMTIAKR